MPLIRSERDLEGYIRIDHRESPGFTEADAVAGHRTSILPYIGKGKLFEAATNSCSHCDRIVIKNPDRIRPRGHCTACDHFICDGCAVVYHVDSECRCKQKRIDGFLQQVSKGTANGT